MNEHIRQLLEEMNAIEDELRTALHEQQERIHFRIRGKRVEFEDGIREAHSRLKTGLLKWFTESRPQNLLSAPFIYGMALPLVFLDICVTIYQAACFPLYRIGKVRRADYIVIDRHHLAYLNVMERLHCEYCGYANGLIAYVREIAARTEQYWCPIKHARKVLGTHARYAQFLDYGDAAGYHAGRLQLRDALAHEQDTKQQEADTRAAGR